MQEPLDPALEPELPLTPAEEQERADAHRSLRHRLAAGPLWSAIGRADRAGMRWTRKQARSRRTTAVVRRYSRLGEHGGFWLVLGTAGFLVDRRHRRSWASGLIGVAVAYLVNTSVKQIARRPRPNFEDLPPLIPTPGPLSFPSSHSASSAAAVVGFAALVPRGPLLVAASTMAVSRVHLGVHYPSDIAVGATLGALVARWVRRRLGWA